MGDNDKELALALGSAIKSMADDMRDLKMSQSAMVLDFRNIAVNMATVLEKVSSLERQVARVDTMEKRLDSMEVRMSMLEVQNKSIVDFKEQHSKEIVPDLADRIKVLETAKVKIVAIGGFLLLVIQLVIEAAKIIF